jgi:maltooligosyltrehalose trehalohydrolase
MKHTPLEEKEYRQTIATHSVGALASAPTASGVNVTFGIYLPGIEPEAGYEVFVRVNHKDDGFDSNIKTMDFPLTPIAHSQYNLWQANVTIPVQPGTYLYRYQLLQTLPGTLAPQVLVGQFTDPFARAMDDEDVLSAFVTPGFVPDFIWTDQDWKTPKLEDLVVYELHVEEFNRNFNGVIERLPYLKSLGITCLELMPITKWKLDFDWGYGPLHYFAPNERWGGVQGLKRLVNACHQAGIAVILDVVYQQVSPSFPYYLIYQSIGIESPMIGRIGPFGPKIDFSKEFAHEYVRAANFHWLDEYHVDGFRYDNVTDLYNGPTGKKYPQIAYETYTTSLTMSRFTPSGGLAPGEYSRIIQCPELLNQPQEILRTTYSNCTWQSRLLNKAEDMARYRSVDDDFVHLLDTRFLGYPERKTVQDIAKQPIEMPVTPFQYLENHNHSRLITFFESWPPDVLSADRGIWYKLQPFAIALYTCQGIPMLWQGQEFAESYIVPLGGSARINFRRDVHWEYSRDDFGGPLLRLYRILGTLRHAYSALRSHESFYFNEQSRTSDGIVAYSRQSIAAQQFAIVFLNFSDQRQSISIPFPEPGTYREMIDDAVRSTPFEIMASNANQSINVDVPSNYGYIFIRASVSKEEPEDYE